MYTCKSNWKSGFTLVELMVTVAILSILAAASVPSLVSSKIAANETTAIGNLRELASAQSQFWSGAAIDDDLDGMGEYGFFAELAGSTPLNGRANGNGIVTPLDPPILSTRFGIVDANGRTTSSGYVYQIYLPNAAGTGVPEGAGGGPTGAENANNCELYWCAYAFPIVSGASGNRVFFVDQRSEIFQSRMDSVRYDDTLGAPTWDAALSAVGGTMSDPVAIGGLASQDTNSWTPVQ